MPPDDDVNRGDRPSAEWHNELRQSATRKPSSGMPGQSDDRGFVYTEDESSLGELQWRKVQSGFSNVDKPSSTTAVSVKACDDAGTVYGPAYDAYAPTRANKATSLFEDDIVGTLEDDKGNEIIVTDCFDDCFLTVKMWLGTVAAIPNGWTLIDGTANTAGSGFDFQDKFLRVFDHGTDAPPGTALTGTEMQMLQTNEGELPAVDIHLIERVN